MSDVSRREYAIREVDPDSGRIKIHGHTDDSRLAQIYRERHMPHQKIVWREIGDWNEFGVLGHDLTVETVKCNKGRRKMIACSCGWKSPLSKTTEQAEKTTRSQHPQAFCPTPDKKRFATREAAAAALLEFWQTARAGKKELRRAYECDCGCWHTTSRPGDDILTPSPPHHQEQAHA